MGSHYWHRYWPPVMVVPQVALAAGFAHIHQWAWMIVFILAAVVLALYALWSWDIPACHVCWRREYLKSRVTSLHRRTK